MLTMFVKKDRISTKKGDKVFMNTKKITLNVLILLLIVTFLPLNKLICLAETEEILDFKLQNYISSIYSNGIVKQGREEPKIDTQDLIERENKYCNIYTG